jgi:Zn-dependent M28 family amino/carboxypeptidase
MSLNRSSLRALVAGSATVALVGFGLTAVPSGAAPASPNACETRNNNTYPKLLDCVTVDGVLEHQEAFQAIADANGGTRADQTPGYLASVDYVVDVLEDAGWDADVVPFTYAGTDSVLQQTAPTTESFPHNVATGTGEGDVTAAVVAVDINLTPPRANTSGCEVADFAGFPAGSIALIQRGGCPFGDKALNAEAAGAAGVILFNQGDPSTADDRFGPVNPTLGGEDIVDIPVVGASFEAGVALSQPGSRARVQVEFVERESFNVIGELPGRNSDNVVMAGAHLDSVPAGPGINDNGSGSSALLEIAQVMGNHKPENTIRFAWWGAEELGLIGSTQWVGQQVAAGTLDEVALYLNFDMIGSPNYIFMIYDANESSFLAPAGVTIPEGSAAIEATFESFYTLRGEPYDDSQFSGRSDYQAFINNGIPSSGLFTGAEQRKTPQQQSIWGGTAGAQFDPCYHQACDTIANLDLHALDVNSDAVAFAVLTYAYSTEDVNGVRGKKVPGNFSIPEPAGPEHTFAGPLAGDEHDHDPVTK